MQSVQKKPTNLSLDPELLQEARGFGINLSMAAELGLRQAVATAKAAKWQAENAQALASSNDWIETNGLPLENFRQF